MRNLSPQELKPLLDRKEVTLLNELPARLGELDPAQAIVAMCHHGVRSEMAGRVLERNGFAQVAHLSGGIDAWSQAVDPSIPRY